VDEVSDVNQNQWWV